MPNTFIAFLKQYTDLSIETVNPALEVKKTGIKTRKEIVESSRATIKSAGEQWSPSQIGRVFNDFPLAFSTETKEPNGTTTQKTFRAVNEDSMKRWADEFFDILMTTTIEQKDKIVYLNKAKYTEDNPSKKFFAAVETTLSTLHITDKTKEGQVHTLISNMLLETCGELLDETGQLQKEVMEQLHLQKLIDMTEMHTVKRLEITYQILFSYYGNIIIAHLTSLLDQRANKLQLSKDEYMQFKEKWGLLQKLLTEQACLDRVLTRDSEGNEFFARPFTLNFKKMIDAHIDIQLSAVSLHKQCAVEFAKMDRREQLATIDMDFKKAVKMNNSDFVMHKVNFWIDLCDYYRNQITENGRNETDHMLMMMIFLHLKDKIVGRTPSRLHIIYAEKYTACQQEVEKPSVSVVEQKASDHTSLSEQTAKEKLFFLFNADENLFFIDDFLEHAKKIKSLSENDHAFFSMLLTYKSKREFIQKPPFEVITIFCQLATSSETSKPVASLLETYQQSLTETIEQTSSHARHTFHSVSIPEDQIPLFEQAESEISLLCDALKKMPFHYVDMPNPFIRPRVDLEFHSYLSLKEIAEELNAFLQKLKSTRVSKDIYEESFKKYRRIFDAIIAKLYKHIDEKFLSAQKLCIMLSNPRMSNYYEEYSYIARRMKEALRNREEGTIDSQIWEKIFQKFCATCPKHVAHFVDFDKTVTKFKKPVEGSDEMKESEVIAIVSDEERFRMVATALTTRDSREAAFRKDKLIQFEKIKKSLPLELLKNLDKFEQHLGHEQFDNALVTKRAIEKALTEEQSKRKIEENLAEEKSKKLPLPTFAKNILGYCSASLSSDAILKMILFEKMEQAQSSVSSMFESEKTKIKFASHRIGLKRILDQVQLTAATPTELIYLLEAEKEAMPNCHRAQVLDACIQEARRFSQEEAKCDKQTYLMAVSLLKIANSHEQSVQWKPRLQFLKNQDKENIAHASSEAARSIAHLLVRLSIASSKLKKIELQNMLRHKLESICGKEDALLNNNDVPLNNINHPVIDLSLKELLSRLLEEITQQLAQKEQPVIISKKFTKQT